MKSCTAVKSTLVGLTTAAFVAVSGSALAAGKLNVSNWAEYMAEDTIENFAKEYDIEVTFTPYDSAEAIDAKLLADLRHDVGTHVLEVGQLGLVDFLQDVALDQASHERRGV